MQSARSLYFVRGRWPLAWHGHFYAGPWSRTHGIAYEVFLVSIHYEATRMFEESLKYSPRQLSSVRALLMDVIYLKIDRKPLRIYSKNMVWSWQESPSIQMFEHILIFSWDCIENPLYSFLHCGMEHVFLILFLFPISIHSFVLVDDESMDVNDPSLFTVGVNLHVTKMMKVGRYVCYWDTNPH